MKLNWIECWKCGTLNQKKFYYVKLFFCCVFALWRWMANSKNRRTFFLRPMKNRFPSIQTLYTFFRVHIATAAIRVICFCPMFAQTSAMSFLICRNDTKEMSNARERTKKKAKEITRTNKAIESTSEVYGWNDKIFIVYQIIKWLWQFRINEMDICCIQFER